VLGGIGSSSQEDLFNQEELTLHLGSAEKRLVEAKMYLGCDSVLSVKRIIYAGRKSG
jgi:hypothetical protein